MRKFAIQTHELGGRLDVFVAGKYPQFTRSSLELLFDKGQVLLDGLAAKPSHRLRLGEIVAVDESLLNAQPPKIVLPIIYEDKDVIVIDKPEGVLTHAKGALNLEGSVASFIANKITDKSLSSNRAGIVHRLDRATSGVIITAKNKEALSKLQKQFSLRKTKKEYQAVIEGKPEPPRAVIDAPILRNPAKPQTFKVDSRGKSAITEYETLESFISGKKQYSLLKLKPKTGRTHQLRVHLAYLKHPIVGDNIYGSGDGNLLLHASSLEITLPNGRREVFTSPLPERMERFINDSKQPS